MEFNTETLDLERVFLHPKSYVAPTSLNKVNSDLLNANSFIKCVELLDDLDQFIYRLFLKYPSKIYIAMFKLEGHSKEIIVQASIHLKSELSNKDRGRYLPEGVVKLWKIQNPSTIVEENTIMYSRITEIKDARQ